jgi:hypothetical protein
MPSRSGILKRLDNCEPKVPLKRSKSRSSPHASRRRLPFLSRRRHHRHHHCPPVKRSMARLPSRPRRNRNYRRCSDRTEQSPNAIRWISAPNLTAHDGGTYHNLLRVMRGGAGGIAHVVKAAEEGHEIEICSGVILGGADFEAAIAPNAVFCSSNLVLRARTLRCMFRWMFRR